MQETLTGELKAHHVEKVADYYDAANIFYYELVSKLSVGLGNLTRGISFC